jgi:hypothetical protein
MQKRIYEYGIDRTPEMKALRLMRSILNAPFSEQSDSHDLTKEICLFTTRSTA